MVFPALNVCSLISHYRKYFYTSHFINKFVPNGTWIPIINVNSYRHLTELGSSENHIRNGSGKCCEWIFCIEHYFINQNNKSVYFNPNLFSPATQKRKQMKTCDIETWRNCLFSWKSRIFTKLVRKKELRTPPFFCE